MDEIRIAHCSDLHFGSARQDEVWQSFAGELQSARPHLILITGDIVHTTRQDLYQTAAQRIGQLVIPGGQAVKWLVCAGNHDRHVYGNAPGRLKRMQEFLSGYKGNPAGFDQAFTGRIPTVANPIDLQLAEGRNSWLLRIIGLDTSSDAAFSAQGHATLSDIEQMGRAARGQPKADLVLVLHHHHLISIAALERQRQSMGQLLQATIMLNAGTMLEALALGHVDIVLHGHEHQRAAARYGALRGDQTQTVVLGAGSATGNSFDGCEVTRASYNLIELRRDRSVHVRERAWEGVAWSDRGQPAQVLDAVAIRRSRFNRRADPSSPPTSRIVRCFEFQANRDIELTQTWTNWELKDGLWGHRTANTSGMPDPAFVRLEWADGQVENHPLIPFLPQPGQTNSYGFDLQARRTDRALAGRISLRYRWLGGALLTRADLDRIPLQKRGDFRSEGREYASVRVGNKLRALSMMIRVPAAFAPAPSEVRVHYAGQDGFQESPDLLLALQHHAPGLFSLEIPFPIPEFRYAVSWPLCDPVPPSAAATRFRSICGDPATADRLLDAFARRVTAQLPAWSATIGLYLPDDGARILTKRGETTIGASPPPVGGPAKVSLDDDNNLFRHAWWGTVQRAVVDPAKPDALFNRDEAAVAIVPIQPFRREADETWALLRLGLKPPADASDDAILREIASAPTYDAFGDGVASVLHLSQEVS